VGIAGRDFEASCGALLRSDEPVALAAGPYGAEALVLQGRPIGEAVVQYGPFVMNDRAGINQVLADYQRTGFGGWPWPTDDSVHPRTSTRFARHGDGHVEERFMVPPT
jgi:quercetin 2,3-dioxygenase